MLWTPLLAVWPIPLHSPMTPDREKLIQRILQFLTALCVLVTVLVVVNVFVGRPFASVIQSEGPAEPKKVRNTRQEVAEYTAATLGSVLHSGSMEDLRKIAAENPQDVQAYLQIANLAFAQKDFQVAAENFHMAAGLDPENADIFLKYVQTLLRQRKVLEVKQALLENTLKDPDLDLYLAYVLAYLNENEQAKEIFKGLIEKNPELSGKINPMLEAYGQYDSTSEAKIEYLQTLLGKAFDELGEYELALGLALDAIKSKDDYRDAWIVAGHAALGAEKYSDAKQALEKAIQLDALSGEAYLYLAYTLQYQNQFAPAAENFQKAQELGLDIGQDASEKLIALSAISEENNQFLDALAIEELKLEQRKGTAQPNEYIRAIHLAIDKVQKPERALVLAEQAYADFPNDPMASNLMGWAYLGTGDSSNAVKYLDQALSIDPKFEAAYYNYGKLYEATGKYDNALEAFQLAIQFSQEHQNTGILDAASSRLQILKSSLKSE